MSSLKDMTDAMTGYSLFGPTGSFEGVTETGLRAEGWTRDANTMIEIWVEGDGYDFRAVSQHIRNGAQYSFSTTGVFNGHPAGVVGLSNPQPVRVPNMAGFVVHDLDSSLDVDALASALAFGQVALEDICHATTAVPGTHQGGSELTDQTIACQAAAHAPGATASSVLLALRTAGGASALAVIAFYFVGDGSNPAAAPAWVQDRMPIPTQLAAAPDDLPALWRIAKSSPRFAARSASTDIAGI